MIKRPLELFEYKKIIELILNGFIRKNGEKFRPNKQLAIALQLEANLGLRIGDIVKLRVNNFKNRKLEINEEKNNKLQYRDINHIVFDFIKDYAIENKLSPTDKLITIKVRNIQTRLKDVVDHLELNNIGTHSFRKMFATTAYEQNNNNLELVKELLNHTSIATTQRYIRVSQQAINAASANINFFS